MTYWNWFGLLSMARGKLGSMLLSLRTTTSILANEDVEHPQIRLLSRGYEAKSISDRLAKTFLFSIFGYDSVHELEQATFLYLRLLYQRFLKAF
jgi:hypothetical protein